MNDNPVHALLDSVSSGQHAHRLSVDDLVRAGRRRQRMVATGVAGGTAAVVAGAAAMVSLTGARHTTGALGAPSTAPANTAPVSTALATTAQPDPSGAPAPNRPFTSLLGTISAAHLLSSGRQVGAFVVTDGCQTTPGLRVVSQGAEQVVVSLQLRLTAPAAVGPSAATSPTADDCHLIMSSATGRVVKQSAEVIADLDAPLGSRALIDQATGKPIPYTADTQTAYPTWLPTGWVNTSGVRPTDLRTWEQDWGTPANALLSLRQTFDAPDSLGGAANVQVNGEPARLVTGARGYELTWWSQGRLYVLTASSSQLCSFPQGASSPMHCTPAVETPGVPMTQADLLRVAESVKAR